MLVYPSVAGTDAEHALAIHQRIGAGKTGEQIDALGLDEAGEPFDELVQRDDVVAVIAKRRRRDRKAELAVSREKVDAIVVHRRGERCAPGFEVGNEIAQARWIEHRAGQHMSARLA